MLRAIGRCLILALVTAATAGFARAESDVLSPRAIGVGEALRAAAAGALAISLNPAGLAMSRSYVLEGSYGYRPADHSHIQSISLCDSVTSRVSACLYYTHLSADVGESASRSLHDVGITLAVPLGASLSLGVTNKYVNYSAPLTDPGAVDTSKKGFLTDVGMMYRIFEPLSVAVVGYNLIGADDARYARAVGGGLAFNGGQHLLLAADARYDFGSDSARFGGGAEYLFSAAEGQQGLPIRLGYVYDTLSSGSFLTGGAGLVTPRMALDLGARKQVSNGDELMLQLSLRLFFPN